MRCERAQEFLTARMDGELSAWRASRLDRHMVACTNCAADLAVTTRLFAALGDLAQTAPVPDRLERDTMRAVRGLADAAALRREGRGWRAWFEVALPVTSAAVVLVLAVRFTTGPGVGAALSPLEGTGMHAVSRPGDPAAPRVRAARAGRHRTPMPITAPPPELAAAPDLFIDLQILRRLEKLQHFDAIRTTRQPAAPAVDPAASNG